MQIIERHLTDYNHSIDESFISLKQILLFTCDYRTIQTPINLSFLQITLDYLKIDVEYSEWESLDAIFKEPEVLSLQTKQLALEIHSKRLFSSPIDTHVLQMYQNTLITLENLGFKKWYSHMNKERVYKEAYNGTTVSCCYEIVFINMRFTTIEKVRPSDSKMTR